MVYVTKEINFSSSHRLYNPNFDNDTNNAIYDKCNNFNGHGHNYKLQVTVAGIPNPETGYLIDLKKLKRIMMEEIHDKVDHKNLNFDVDFLKGVIPTVENLSVIFWQILDSKIIEGKLYKIKLWETEASFVEYFGEEIEVRRFEGIAK